VTSPCSISNMSRLRPGDDELGVQLGDAVPLWFERLSSEGLLDDGAKVALMNLFDAMVAIGGRENQLLWRSEGLLTSSNGTPCRSTRGRPLPVSRGPEPGRP
jgi:hypothetical protein